jgi:hypothetical protein
VDQFSDQAYRCLTAALEPEKNLPGYFAQRRANEIAGIAPWVLVGVLGLDKIGLMHETC